MNWNFLLPSESNEALSLVDLFSSTLDLKGQLRFWAWRKKRTKMDTVYRGYSTGYRRWHRREEAMTERLKPSWWGWLEKGLASDKATPRLRRTFSLCLGLMLKKIHWTIYSTAGLHWSLNHQQRFLPTYPLKERESSYLGFNSPASVLGSGSEVHLFTFYSHFNFFSIWLSLNV